MLIMLETLESKNPKPMMPLPQEFSVNRAEPKNLQF
jgi:hypothetical protein